jgi:hypothetical protein
MHFKYYLNDDERRELIQAKGIGEAGCLLFEYYLRLAAKGENEVSDDGAAWHFGWKTQKTQRLRLELTKAGWFRHVRSNYTDGRKGITYYVGKQAVRESQSKKKPRQPSVLVPANKSPVAPKTPKPTGSLFKSP